jgi:glycosyltransferase involved in cell wall biosynthesis
MAAGARRINVLVFVTSFDIGGSERQAVELIKNLDRRVFAPSIACIRREGPLLEELKGSVECVPGFPLTAFYNVSALRQSGRFYRFLRESRPDVVQCFDYYSNVFVVPAARLAGVPVVLTARRDEAVIKSRMQLAVEAWCHRRATGVVINADALKARLVSMHGIDPARVWSVHNGLNIERFDSQGMLHQPEYAFLREGGGVTVAVVANLRQEKGHLMFLEAARLVSNRHSGVRFLIIGEGPMRPKIESRIKALQLEGTVRMTGAIRHIPSALQWIDIAVLPSVANEGFPNAVMEAMASCLPVVATDTGGTRELIIDGHTGFLAAPGDPAALADRLGTLIDDADLRKKMGERGRFRIVTEFTTEKMARRFERLYRTLLASSAGSLR